MPSPAPSPARCSVRGRILLADDSASCRESIAEVLARSGYDCTGVESAAQVLTQVQSRQFDLLIADIHMPGNAALEMVRELAGISAAPPVLLVTGRATLETATLAVRLNAVGYLLKPVDPGELLEVADEAINASQIRQMLRTHCAQLDELRGQMRELETTTNHAVGAAANEALSAYVALSTAHFLRSVTELRNLVDAIVERDHSGKAARRLAGARPLLLLEALRETIMVLERTKHSFKSRELAELRHKLETLLAPGAVGATATQVLRHSGKESRVIH